MPNPPLGDRTWTLDDSGHLYDRAARNLPVTTRFASDPPGRRDHPVSPTLAGSVLIFGQHPTRPDSGLYDAGHPVPDIETVVADRIINTSLVQPSKNS
ncbi:MAG: hypothetical protein ACR2J8_03755 [Thermomicrobiales bacterium]